MDAEEHEFTIPLAGITTPKNPNVFLRDEPDRPLTRKEKAWVKENQHLPVPPPAPSTPALRALGRSLEKYRGTMPVSKEEWQNYCLERYYMLSQDLDPKIAKSAIDSLARTNVVKLLTDEQTVNINARSTIELESELANKISALLTKAKSGGSEAAIDGEYKELN